MIGLASGARILALGKNVLSRRVAAHSLMIILATALAGSGAAYWSYRQPPAYRGAVRVSVPLPEWLAHPKADAPPGCPRAVVSSMYLYDRFVRSVLSEGVSESFLYTTYSVHQPWPSVQNEGVFLGKVVRPIFTSDQAAPIRIVAIANSAAQVEEYLRAYVRLARAMAIDDVAYVMALPYPQIPGEPPLKGCPNPSLRDRAQSLVDRPFREEIQQMELRARYRQTIASVEFPLNFDVPPRLVPPRHALVIGGASLIALMLALCVSVSVLSRNLKSAPRQ